jgi:hypothetical protein
MDKVDGTQVSDSAQADIDRPCVGCLHLFMCMSPKIEGTDVVRWKTIEMISMYTSFVVQRNNGLSVRNSTEWLAG